MKSKLTIISTLSLLIMGCAQSYEPINFQTINVPAGTYNSYSCKQINKEVDRALIETNTIFIDLLKDETIRSPQIDQAGLYFNNAKQSELIDFSRLKGELAALSVLSTHNDCGRYVMSPEELIEYQLNQVRLGRGLDASTSYPFKILKFNIDRNN